MKELVAKFKLYFTTKKFLKTFALGFLLLFVSLVINYYAGLYATERASNYVSDIILSNIPVFDLDWLFVWGPVIFWIFIAFMCIKEPRRAPYVLKSIALFIIIRSAFISMTHIGPYPDQIAIDTGTTLMKSFTSGSDLFFSAHTGLPFLMAMIFYREKPMRYFCIAAAVFFGIVVLLTHRHYTIDVASAFFITYAISRICKKFFSHDAVMFEKGLETVA